MKKIPAQHKRPAARQATRKEATAPWYMNPVWWLTAITILLYARTLTLGFTRLDDSIFIIENESYNKGFSNIATSFSRGLFHPTRDVYFRPLFLVDFIIESKVFGTKPAGYHFTNLMFHLLSVVLLYAFLRRMAISPVNAFLLAMLFAVHPVLSQAVAWIPGRNDMLLMIFFLSGLIVTTDYVKDPGPGRFAAQFLLFLLAMFTKETAVIIPVITACVLLFVLRIPWRKTIPLFTGWGVALMIWFLVRNSAQRSHRDDLFSDMLHSVLSRLPAVIQYTGKIVFPFNLTVFPILEDISLLWGIAATVVLAALIVVSGSYRKPLAWIGLFWFLAFLLPVLIVPKSLNDQVFEHRLYLPMGGILLLLATTLPFSERYAEKKRMVIIGAVGLCFAVISFIRVGYYADPLTFWTKAVEGSPRSAYARMLLGTKVESPADRERLFLEAWELNPSEKNLNYYLGKVMAEKKSFDSAAFFLKREAADTQNPDVFFLLAQLAYMKQHSDTAAIYLEKTISLDPMHPQANPNLVLVYMQLGQADKARSAVESMRLKGMQVPPDLEKMVAVKK